MIEAARQLYALLDRHARQRSLVVFLSMILAALADTLGVASIMPFVQLALDPDKVADVPVLGALHNQLGEPPPTQFVIWVGFGVLTLLVGSLLLRALSFWAQAVFAARRKHHLATALLTRYLGQPYEWSLQHHSSELASSVLDESIRTIDQSLYPLLQFVANALVVLALGLLLVLIDPWMALGATVILGGGYLGMFTVIRKLNVQYGKLLYSSVRKRFHAAQEAFGGFKDVKLLGLEVAFRDRFVRPSEEFARAEFALRTIGELPRFAMQGIVFSGMVLAVIYVLQTRGSLDAALPALAGFAFAGFRLLPSLQAVYAEAVKLSSSAPILKAVHDALQEGSSDLHSIHGNDDSPMTPEHSIRLRDIHYRYPKADQNALAGVDLDIRSRTTVGIVGSTGSGKTTLVDVLLGLLPPTSGTLEVDGTRIDAQNSRRWQDALGYVPQQIYLTDDDILANVAFGVPRDQINEAAVERAAQAANLHEFVMRQLPEGYRTHVGERGVRLSGGQRQRIGIARALYHDPAVLVMDEATSALDNVTERSVMDAIENLEGEKTIILIAHRLSTVRRCARIFVMQEGRCAASGTWEELLELDARFRDMVEVAEAQTS